MRWGGSHRRMMLNYLLISRDECSRDLEYGDGKTSHHVHHFDRFLPSRHTTMLFICLLVVSIRVLVGKQWKERFDGSVEVGGRHAITNSLILINRRRQ